MHGVNHPHQNSSSRHIPFTTFLYKRDYKDFDNSSSRYFKLLTTTDIKIKVYKLNLECFPHAPLLEYVLWLSFIRLWVQYIKFANTAASNHPHLIASPSSRLQLVRNCCIWVLTVFICPANEPIQVNLWNRHYHLPCLQHKFILDAWNKRVGCGYLGFSFALSSDPSPYLESYFCYPMALLAWLPVYFANKCWRRNRESSKPLASTSEVLKEADLPRSLLSTYTRDLPTGLRSLIVLLNLPLVKAHSATKIFTPALACLSF